MKYAFLLSGDYVDLAKEEVISLFNADTFYLIDRLFIVDLKNNSKVEKISKRAALTKNIYKLLFECKINELTDLMKKHDWNSIYKDDFCLRIHYFKNNKNKINKNTKQFSEINLAKYIWSSIRTPKVNLKNPKTRIELFIVDGKVYCGLLIYKNNDDFESRKSHLRPFTHPSSLHPKLARALVNIIGIKEKEILLDPFCGTGGVLIEAGLMGIKVIGYDISKNMAKGCKENLKYFKIKKFDIVNKNALQMQNKFDYVVTDLPYGLNSNVYLQYNKKSLKYNFNKINLKTNQKNKIQNIEMFYLKFLQKLRKILKKKAVIIFPSYVNHKKLLKIAKFKIEREFSIYMHRSLTRKIARIK